jgi:hypothetical protein
VVVVKEGRSETLMVNGTLLVGSVTAVAVTVADPAAPVVGALYVTAVAEGLVSVPCPVRLQVTPAAAESFDTIAVI